MKTGRRGGHGIGWSLTHMWQIKNRRIISGARGPSLILGSPAQGSSARKISPRNFWQKLVGNEAVGDRNCGILRQFILKGPCTDLLGLTASELQHGAAD